MVRTEDNFGTRPLSVAKLVIDVAKIRSYSEWRRSAYRSANEYAFPTNRQQNALAGKVIQSNRNLESIVVAQSASGGDC